MSLYTLVRTDHTLQEQKVGRAYIHQLPFLTSYKTFERQHPRWDSFTKTSRRSELFWRIKIRREFRTLNEIVGVHARAMNSKGPARPDPRPSSRKGMRIESRYESDKRIKMAPLNTIEQADRGKIQAQRVKTGRKHKRSVRRVGVRMSTPIRGKRTPTNSNRRRTAGPPAVASNPSRDESNVTLARNFKGSWSAKGLSFEIPQSSIASVSSSRSASSMGPKRKETLFLDVNKVSNKLESEIAKRRHGERKSSPPQVERKVEVDTKRRKSVQESLGTDGQSAAGPSVGESKSEDFYKRVQPLKHTNNPDERSHKIARPLIPGAKTPTISSQRDFWRTFDRIGRPLCGRAIPVHFLDPEQRNGFPRQPLEEVIEKVYEALGSFSASRHSEQEGATEAEGTCNSVMFHEDDSLEKGEWDCSSLESDYDDKFNNQNRSLTDSPILEIKVGSVAHPAATIENKRVQIPLAVGQAAQIINPHEMADTGYDAGASDVDCIEYDSLAGSSSELERPGSTPIPEIAEVSIIRKFPTADRKNVVIPNKRLENVQAHVTRRKFSGIQIPAKHRHGKVWVENEVESEPSNFCSPVSAHSGFGSHSEFEGSEDQLDTRSRNAEGELAVGNDEPIGPSSLHVDVAPSQETSSEYGCVKKDSQGLGNVTVSEKDYARCSTSYAEGNYEDRSNVPEEKDSQDVHERGDILEDASPGCSEESANDSIQKEKEMFFYRHKQSVAEKEKNERPHSDNSIIEKKSTVLFSKGPSKKLGTIDEENNAVLSTSPSEKKQSLFNYVSNALSKLPSLVGNTGKEHLSLKNDAFREKAVDEKTFFKQSLPELSQNFVISERKLKQELTENASADQSFNLGSSPRLNSTHVELTPVSPTLDANEKGEQEECLCRDDEKEVKTLEDSMDGGPLKKSPNDPTGDIDIQTDSTKAESAPGDAPSENLYTQTSARPSASRASSGSLSSTLPTDSTSNPAQSTPNTFTSSDPSTQEQEEKPFGPFLPTLHPLVFPLPDSPMLLNETPTSFIATFPLPPLLYIRSCIIHRPLWEDSRTWMIDFIDTHPGRVAVGYLTVPAGMEIVPESVEFVLVGEKGDGECRMEVGRVPGGASGRKKRSLLKPLELMRREVEREKAAEDERRRRRGRLLGWAIYNHR